MAVRETNAGLVQFGPFKLDLHTLELKKRGHRLKLGPQPIKVLTLLAIRSGELVSREELQLAVWGKDTFIDFEQGLNFCIRQLRATLDDDAENPRYIETVPRRGYRFIGELTSNGAVNGKGAEPNAQLTAKTHVVEFPQIPLQLPEKRSLGPRRWLRLAAVATILLVLILGLVLWFRSTTNSPRSLPAVSLKERVLTANSSENPVAGAAVSADGKYLAYADATGLYVKPLSGNSEAHRLFVAACSSPEMNGWFPDGTRLAITCRQQITQEPSVWTVSVFGGSARKLIDQASTASVSPDGSYIAFLRKEPGRELWVMRADGTEASRVIAEQPLIRFGSPAWSPDGESIAYFKLVWGYLNPTRSIETITLQNGQAKTLLSDHRLSEALAWRSSGALLYSMVEAVPNEVRSSIWEQKVQNGNCVGTPTPIVARTGITAAISVSQDAKVVAFTQMNWQEQVFVGTLSTDGKRLLAHRRLTLDENINVPFAWTPDGKSVLFSSNRDGHFAIFRQTISEPMAEAVVSARDLLHIPRLSPDASEILYLSVPQNGGPEMPSSIYGLSFAGGAPRLILQKPGISNLQCARLPSTTCIYSAVHDNDFMIYSFDSRSGSQAELYRLQPGVPTLNWSLSPDGSTLAIIPQHTGEARIQLLSIGGHSSRELPIHGWLGLFCVDWAADGKSLFVSTVDPEGGNSLLHVWLNGYVSVLLRKTHGQVEWGFPSPDGRSLAIAENSGTSNILAVDLPNPR